jgi:predicted phage terminase large subunit-like protein
VPKVFKPKVRLTAATVRGFTEVFLLDSFDGSTPSPSVHDEWWEMCCSPTKLVGIAAPRGHAKSTAITIAYTLANICHRFKQYVVIVAKTEEVAIDFITIIRDELRHNQDLRDVYDIQSLPTDGKTDCIVRFTDGSEARIRARGAGQSVRGMIWKHTRPDLVVIDDLEDDEAVESADRRTKLKNWVLKALIPVVSKTRGDIRIIGTILHDDSVLMNIMKSSAWKTALYKAHTGFNDFTNKLWPEYWTEKALRETRQTYIDMGDPEGYSQEYLNDPSDLQNPYFKDDDFIPMDELDHKKPKSYYVGVDFALSDNNTSDYTVMTTGGYDSDGVLHIVNQRKLRTDDTAVIIDELFSIMNTYHIEYFLFEGGVIANAVKPPFRVEMRKRNKFSYIETYTPIGNKRLRAASIQQRMRSGGVRYDIEAEWFEDHKHELKRFPRGTKDDQVDAIAWLGRGIDDFVEAPTADEESEDKWSSLLDEHGVDLDTHDYSDGGGY